MKLPQSIVREIFYRTAKACEQVKTSHLFLHRGCCPLCGEIRKRMYLKEYHDHYLVYCHNCGYSHKFEVYLKSEFPDEYARLKPYVLESMRDGSIFKKPTYDRTETVKLITDEQADQKINQYVPKVSFSIMEEQDNPRHERYRAFCLKYLIDRRIPETIFKDFICIYKGPLAGYVGIPFYDKHKKYLIHIQGRLVLPHKGWDNQQKYLFVKDEERGLELENKPLWGTWRVNIDEPVIICEGTLDACAFTNAIATCGATVSEHFIDGLIEEYPNRIWCVDNYWTDKAGRDLTNRLLTRGETCLIIPKEHIGEKDANDLIKHVFKQETYIPMAWVNANLYVGKLGLVKLKIQLKAVVA